MITYDELIDFCYSNIDKMKLDNESNKVLVDTCARYLFNNKLNEWNKKDAIFFIKATTKQFFEQYNIEDFTTNILSQEDLENNFGKGNLANCSHMYYDGKVHFQMNYGQKIISLLTSNDYSLSIFAMHTMFHELAHAYQQILIHSDEKFSQFTDEQYLLTIEDIYMRNLQNNKDESEYEEFYNENYLNLYSEKDADEHGIKYVKEFLQKWNKTILEQDEVKKIITDMENETDSKETVQLIMQEQKEVEKLIPDNLILLKQYPILNTKFNKKDIKEEMDLQSEER